MMQKIFLPLILLTLLATNTQAQFKGALDKAKKAASSITSGGISQEEAGNGLKEALDAGVGEAVDFLSKEDGYLKSPYKILLPEEARKVVSKVSSIPGFSDVESNLIEKMNRAAESAASKAKPIFVSAIKQLTFKDAMNILMGNDDAATRYLESTTFQQLYDEFLPVIQVSLDEVNAREYWRSVVTAYNKIPFVEKTNPELDDHVNQMALKGMFSLIEKREKGIRNDVGLRTSPLLQKVFAQQDK